MKEGTNKQGRNGRMIEQKERIDLLIGCTVFVAVFNIISDNGRLSMVSEIPHY